MLLRSSARRGLLALSTSNVWIVHVDSPCGQPTWTSAGDHHPRRLNLQEKVGRGTLDLELSLDSYSGAPRGPRASPGPQLGLQRNVTNLLKQGSISFYQSDRHLPGHRAQRAEENFTDCPAFGRNFGIFFVFAKGLRAQRAGRVAPRRGGAKRRAAALGAAQRRKAPPQAAERRAAHKSVFFCF